MILQQHDPTTVLALRNRVGIWQAFFFLVFMTFVPDTRETSVKGQELFQAG